MLDIFALLILGVLSHVRAAPAPGAVAEAPHPMITAKATLVDRTPTPVLAERGLTDYVGSLISELGSAIPSYVASGVPNYFQDFPTGGDVLSKLGINTGDLAAQPTAVLILP